MIAGIATVYKLVSISSISDAVQGASFPCSQGFQTLFSLNDSEA